MTDITLCYSEQVNMVFDVNDQPSPVKREGESCGGARGRGRVWAGKCAPGLECKHNPLLADASGTCVRPHQGKIVTDILYFISA